LDVGVRPLVDETRLGIVVVALRPGAQQVIIQRRTATPGSIVSPERASRPFWHRLLRCAIIAQSPNGKSPASPFRFHAVDHLSRLPDGNRVIGRLAGSQDGLDRPLENAEHLANVG
jgi:hypothetical protein